MLNGKITIRLQNKIANAIVLTVLAVGSVIAQPASYQIDGTTGAPLGGIGAGAVKFCGNSGTFAGTWRTPCALDDFTSLPNTSFQFFSQLGGGTPATSTKLSAVITGGRSDDDAVYPLQTANFGTVNGIKLDLIACSPWDLSNVEVMCYPYAFFQVQVTNTNAQSADVAVALQASLTAATTYVAGKGMKNDDGTLKKAVYASSNDPTAIISVGNDNGFLTTGLCNNTISGAINKVAVKVSLAANETKLIKFVYAWNNNVFGDEGIHDGMFYYLNKFPAAQGAGPVADTGLAHFDQFRDNAVSLVARMRKSNLPDWLKNQTMASLVNLTSNSMYRQNGRYAHTEGEWATNGTNDQMFHSRQIFTALVPSLNWNELHYWARTQKTNPIGQIHHDVDSCTDDENFTASRNMAYMCPWDAQQHHDYRNIDLWVDLNCVFVVSVYEAFIATADTAQLSFLWPYVRLAGLRVIQQLTDNNRGASDGFPYLFSPNTQNTYDADGSTDMSAYNNSIAMPTFKTLALMSTIKGDTLATKFSKYYDSMRTEFPKYYFTAAHFPAIRSENVMTGQWLNYFLKFGELVDSSKQVYALSQLSSLYNPTAGFTSLTKTYAEWSEYLVAHYGGLALQTGRYTEWQGLQYDWYQRTFNNRDLVYDIELGIPDKVTTSKYLATNLSCFNHYISVPVLWRNYYTIIGFQRNKYTRELWLEPCLPSSSQFTAMNHTLTDALVLSAEGPAAISFKETGTTYKVQDIVLKPDSPIDVTDLYVKDKGLATNYVKINGVLVDNTKITKVGTGFARELKISYNGTIPSGGLSVTVSDDPNFSSSFAGIRHDGARGIAEARTIFSSTPNSFTIATPPSHSYAIQICDLNGRTLKVLRGNGAANVRVYSSARHTENSLSPGIYAVRVSIGNSIFSKCFVLSE